MSEKLDSEHSSSEQPTSRERAAREQASKRQAPRPQASKTPTSRHSESHHRAQISWQRQTDDFSYEAYSRDHQWQFSPNIVVEASAAPAFRGTAGRVDPEEAFVAAVASCHMLTFLAIASRKRLKVNSYEDEAVGILEKNSKGALAITRVSLQPVIVFDPETPASSNQIERMHELSHKECFIANSVTTEITVQAPKIP